MGSQAVIKLVSNSPEETVEMGRKLGSLIRGSTNILLCGDYGSGKTTLVKGIAKGLGVKRRVRSPSFIICNRYAGPIPLYHLDLFRIDDPKEIEEIGILDIEEPERVLCVEWGGKFSLPIGGETLHIDLAITGRAGNRRLVLLYLDGLGRKFQEVLKAELASGSRKKSKRAGTGNIRVSSPYRISRNEEECCPQ